MSIGSIAAVDPPSRTAVVNSGDVSTTTSATFARNASSASRAAASATAPSCRRFAGANLANRRSAGGTSSAGSLPSTSAAIITTCARAGSSSATRAPSVPEDSTSRRVRLRPGRVCAVSSDPRPTVRTVMTAAQQLSLDELGEPLRTTTFVVVDLETTGGSAGADAITEIGAVKVCGGESLGEFQTLVNPGRAIDPFVSVLTGITDSM